MEQEQLSPPQSSPPMSSLEALIQAAQYLEDSESKASVHTYTDSVNSCLIV